MKHLKHLLRFNESEETDQQSIRGVIKKEPEYVDSEEEFLFRGGYNKNPNPFNVGDIIKRIGGQSVFEVIGYKGMMMILLPKNKEALYGMDDIRPEVINHAIKLGYKPSMNMPQQLHYKYADEFKLIKKLADK